MSDIAIRVEGLSKLYHIGKQERYSALRDTLTDLAAAPFRRLRSAFSRNGHSSPSSEEERTIWALKDVSFEVKRGEVVGIIGRNGAGKSTLLKILSRITEPTEGHADVYGRVASLLEVGTGFHPELTGRENIYLNGAILGMPRKEMDRKFDEIVAFAEIEQFLDTAVKFYSSGMYMRLAFAVAAHLEPEILVVDEVLAVGDAAFQKKCLGKMGEVAREGRTVLFVSHNMAAITNLCPKAMLLVGGQKALLAPSKVVVAKYLHDRAAPAEVHWVEPGVIPGDETIRLRAVSILDYCGNVTETVDMEHNFTVQMEYELLKPASGLHIGFRLAASDGTIVLTSGDADDPGHRLARREAGRYTAQCIVPGGLLSPQTYVLSFGAHVPNVHSHFFVDAALSVTIARTQHRGTLADDRRQGVICPILPWQIHLIGGISACGSTGLP